MTTLKKGIIFILYEFKPAVDGVVFLALLVEANVLSVMGEVV